MRTGGILSITVRQHAIDRGRRLNFGMFAALNHFGNTQRARPRRQARKSRSDANQWLQIATGALGW